VFTRHPPSGESICKVFLMHKSQKCVDTSGAYGDRFCRKRKSDREKRRESLGRYIMPAGENY